ncbi:TIGR03084 family metal-binding protein [Streptantibioticus ferralitis]|uniref:TIGR03084 family metal-binding protein n=1 Tax=Streptantibioticus ferralitis TaxID=236510 RepID=A0ABT5Z324_9ACTN|nr:TIGR03084 family metal-binding protein [Streptantibioticus ferralitis]MDF2258235.1 TIGR03084 family metal-binding protein [Streptantibioticus ferralitis]
MADSRLVREVLTDLAAESEELDTLVAGLSEERWRGPTPAPGWTIAHQIAHLAWTDRATVLTLTDPAAFAREAERAARAISDYVDDCAAEGAAQPLDALLRRWCQGRTQLRETLAAQPPDARFPWFGPPMSTASMATARLMETWAHGQDIADALGVRRTPTSRLRHVARIGVRARDHAFTVHGLIPPETAFRVELTAPDGQLWTYGPADAEQRVTGPALDFCLLATQRRHRADLAVTAHGPDADRWLDIAQAFAGPPGAGRTPTAVPRGERAGTERDETE